MARALSGMVRPVPKSVLALSYRQAAGASSARRSREIFAATFTREDPRALVAHIGGRAAHTPAHGTLNNGIFPVPPVWKDIPG